MRPKYNTRSLFHLFSFAFPLIFCLLLLCVQHVLAHAHGCPVRGWHQHEPQHQALFRWKRRFRKGIQKGMPKKKANFRASVRWLVMLLPMNGRFCFVKGRGQASVRTGQGECVCLAVATRGTKRQARRVKQDTSVQEGDRGGTSDKGTRDSVDE